jgi:hypothetical protein
LASPEEIIAGAAEYAKRAEMPYIAYPSTWLNGERWADEEVQEKPVTNSNDARLRQMADMIRRAPSSAFCRDWAKTRITDQDVQDMVRAGLITAEEARRE